MGGGAKLYDTGLLADLTIRVRIDPTTSASALASASAAAETEAVRPAKRARSTTTTDAAAALDDVVKEGEKDEGGQQQEEEAGDGVHVIHAHVFPLITASAYFSAALTGQFQEARQRVVEVTLPDAQALEDFKTLIRLAYDKKFVQTNEVPRSSRPTLPPSEAKGALLRRIVLADSFGFYEALKQCCKVLGGWVECADFTFDDAVDVFSILPEPLLEQSALNQLLKDLGKILAKGGENPGQGRRARLAEQPQLPLCALCRLPLPSRCPAVPAADF